MYILCSVQLSLLVNLATTSFSVALAKLCTWSAKLAALCRTEIFKNSFLLYTINEWNKLDPEIRRIGLYAGFRNKLLNFIKPTGNFWKFQTFSIYDPLGIKLHNRLRVDFSQINEQKFRYNFADTLNPLWSCSRETETAHFFLGCRNYTNIRITLMSQLNDIDNSITSRWPNELLRIIFYNDCKFKDNVNKRIESLI